jgi:hypothetical protein
LYTEADALYLDFWRKVTRDGFIRRVKLQRWSNQQ